MINLKRNSSTLSSLEPKVQPRFYQLSSLNERKRMHDRSMLVFYLAFHGYQQCCQFVCAKKCLSPLKSRNSFPHALGIPIVSSPIPLDFQFKELPLAQRIQKSCPWYRYGYFLESPNIGVFGILLFPDWTCA